MNSKTRSTWKVHLLIGIGTLLVFWIGWYAHNLDAGPKFIRDDKDPTYEWASDRISPDTVRYYLRHNVYLPE